MALTKTQAVNQILAKARSYVGYNPGRTYSVFGAWYGWPTALWCAAGTSKPFYDILGDTLAKKVIGYQLDGPNQRGWIWTVAFRQWLMANGKKVALKDIQPLDIMFFKYPTSDSRNKNAVNHVDLCEANHYASGYITTFGPNTPKPGTWGDPSNGRGFWRQYRSINDPYIVDVYRPNWAALGSDPKPPTPPKKPAPPKGEDAEHLEILDYPATTAGVKSFQKAYKLEVDGIVGPKTTARLETEVSKIIDAAVKDIVAQVNKHTTNRTIVYLNKATQAALGEKRTSLTLSQASDALLMQTSATLKAVNKTPEPPTPEEIVKAFLQTNLRGFSIEWWLRQGLILDDRVVDPGSPAHTLLAIANALDVPLQMYTPNGPVPLEATTSGFETVSKPKGTHNK